MAADGLRRRSLLAAGAGGLAATAGCIGELRNILGRQPTSQLSLTISTVPAERDRFSIRIANHLRRNLRASGIDARVEPKENEILLRDVLMNHDFDIYVARYPGAGTPLTLWELLHSKYAEEMGWQNPFGFTNLQVNEDLTEMLNNQGERFRAIVTDLQHAYVREQPFTTVAVPDFVSAHRTGRFDRWPSGGLHDPAAMMDVSLVDEGQTMSLLTSDGRITRNRNPIAAEHRDGSLVTGLLYEPLVRHVHGEPVPWLAESVELSSRARRTHVSIDLRSTPWHDGPPVTASDVAFTYRFLNDTSLGEQESPVPTPYQRGRTSLVSVDDVPADDRVELIVDAPEEQLVWPALETGILPEHVWADKTQPADVAGLDLVGSTTEAHVWNNQAAIGSGPLRFVEAVEDESVTLERFDDHFLHDGPTPNLPESLGGGIDATEVGLEVVPSHDVAIELLQQDEADATSETLDPSVIPRIGRSADLSLSVAGTTQFYHVGYNCRQAPLSDPNFRQILARHVDRTTLVGDAFDGYADPVESPLAPRWVPEELIWDGAAVQPFLGEEGEVDVEAARDAFREAGYRYSDDRLVRRGSR